MNRTPALLKRLPFQSDDIREFVGIARRLCRGLNIAVTKNADLAREVVAKACLYNDMHEVRSSIGRVPYPTVGSITRADVQLLVAYGFQRHTEIPFLEAWQRAGRARLRGLSIDQVTVERQREERFKARGLKGDQDAITSAQRPATNNWHDDQARFFKHGAPSFDLCVRPDGRAFHWEAFTAVYDAIRSSRFERSIVDPLEQFPAGSEEAVDKFLSESLIPQSWIPVSQHIQDGLVTLDHEVVWLFVESGLYIGRAIRHKAHGGFLPRLFLTEEEVAEGLDFVVRGAYVQGGSSQLPSMLRSPKGDELVYTLKAGARRPDAISNPQKEVRVPIEDLELTPNLYAGSHTMLRPGLGTKQVVWGLDGKAVKATASQSVTSTYFESTAWLSEIDMPSLFPDFRPGPPVDDRDTFAFARDVQNKVFLPPKALDFQDRASSILARKEKAARERLQETAETGEFLAVCKVELPAEGVEVMAGDLLAELSPGSDSAELGKRARSVSAHIILRYPVLAHYGPLALNAAISVHCQGEPFADFYVETLPLSDVLVGLVMLQAGFKQGGAFRFFKSAPSKIAVSQWLAGVTDLDAVHEAAAGLEGYAAALKAQQERIARIEAVMKHDAERRRVAFDHGYLYVGAELPRAKPRSVMQMLGSLGD
ncbi:hypothetical protein H8F21_14780 [Pseudomonas sp. P66]|uniref:Uncharacterized protein n=1 Tax=Pseudomonas arcuscaelestis TaxID=2710591 RepID=A0ABS2BYX7_9PSED|nr:hypothetical protein [Pseudomonas arcuscaelestis]MBM5458831.1 hypothetical protein [Pseudomonas arcuscaelestis]